MSRVLAPAARRMSAEPMSRGGGARIQWRPAIAAVAAALLLFTVVLGYGGDNWLISAAFPLPFLWALVAVLALTIGPPGLMIVWRHHRILFTLWLLAFAGGAARLLVDLPADGLLALRHSIYFIASVALFFGAYLGWRRAGERWTWLAIGPIALILAYTLTFPWRDALQAVSPVGGAFVPVPLLGHYQYFPIAVAAAWAAFFAGRRMSWPPFLLLAIALLGVGMVQQRLGYIAVAIGATLGLALTARREGLQAIGMRSSVAVWAVALFLTIAAVHPFAGRYGAFDAQFLAQHLSTILGRHGPALGSVLHRYAEYPIAIERLFEQPLGALLAGNGLGAVIELGVTGIYRTKLHLDYVEVVYRAGLAGVLWIASTVGIVATLLARIRRHLDAGAAAPRERTALLMIAGALVMSLVMAAFEPLFFWAYGSVPFFLYAGLGLGAVDRMAADADERAPA